MKTKDLSNYCLEITEENSRCSSDAPIIKKKTNEYDLQKNLWIPNPCGNLYISEFITSDEEVTGICVNIHDEENTEKSIQVDFDKETNITLYYGKPTPYYKSECTLRIKEKEKNIDNPKVKYLY